MPIKSLPSSARTADPALRASALLDIGIYTLTWASLLLDSHPDSTTNENPTVVSRMSKVNGVDEVSSVILNYEKLGVQAICTCSMRTKSGLEFCRIEGEKIVIIIGGMAASKPGFLTIRLQGEEEKRVDFDISGMSFQCEADAVDADLRAGRTESERLPLAVTKRMTVLMDKIHAQNWLEYSMHKMLK